MQHRTFCSQTNADEPLAGTADWVDAWLLLEYRPVWTAKAHKDNSLAPHVRSWIDGTLAALASHGLRTRLQFVRQPEYGAGPLRLLFGLPQRLIEFAGPDYDFLLDLDLLTVASGVAAGTSGTHTGRAVPDPQYFVCTNGQRDLCCARFGLPVYAALRERVNARAWQITHVGGHRFAANVLTWPHGALYGRVTAHGVPAFVDTVERGELAFAYLRGRTFQPPHVQAAEAFVARDGLRLLHVDGDARQARIAFADRDREVAVEVARAAAPLVIQTSCGDTDLEAVYPYRRV